MFRFAFLFLSLLVSATASSQQYPDRAIRIIVPFPAGDGIDIQARLIGQHLTERWGQQVLVDNRPGAGTLIGTELATKAPHDGYTLLLLRRPTPLIRACAPRCPTTRSRISHR
jgi:tripartite-type tricarboxylate transporter receptor subunit TctC